MITFFSIPKPFKGHIGVIQRNAIESWLRTAPDAEIMLFGDEEGTKEACHDRRVTYFPAIRRTPFGTPLLSDVFRVAQEEAQNDIVCFVNADIIFLRDVIDCVKNIELEDFLLVGTRYNTDIEESLDFSGRDIEQQLKSYVSLERSNGLSGSDFFIFPKNKSYRGIPDFAVGRPVWDNWMFLNAHLKNIPMIDTSRSILCIHQNHDYSHVPQRRENSSWDGPEGDYNKILYYKYYFELNKEAQDLYKSDYDKVLRTEVFAETNLVHRLDQWLPVPVLALYDATHYIERGGAIFPYKRQLFSKTHFALFCDRSALKYPHRKLYNRIIKRLRKAFFNRKKAEKKLTKQRLNYKLLANSFVSEDFSKQK